MWSTKMNIDEIVNSEIDTLLFLIAIVLGDSRFEQHAIGQVFRFDKYTRLLLNKSYQ
jgi:hypothetical protein